MSNNLEGNNGLRLYDTPYEEYTSKIRHLLTTPLSKSTWKPQEKQYQFPELFETDILTFK